MSESIIIKGGYDIGQVGQMVEMSKTLKQHIIEQKLYTNITGKNYVHCEGWQFAGGLMGLYPRIAAVQNLSNEREIKWQATAEIIRIKDDAVVCRGIAICSNKENKKKSFDEYALLSMAQTRAIGKAYRNLIGWVMKLAGYESTPAEEMADKKGEIDNSLAFEKLYESIKEREDKLEKARIILTTPPFELDDTMRAKLEELCK